MKTRFCALIWLILFAQQGWGGEKAALQSCAGSTEGTTVHFEHSTIGVMYDDDNIQRLKDYNVDVITWGGQVDYFLSSIERKRRLFEKYKTSGLRSYSADIALIQEGGKYVMCGGVWSAACNRQYWQLRDMKAPKDSIYKQIGKNRRLAVIDANGNIVGVPWLQKRNMTVPMACVNDPGYKQWLYKKLDVLLSLSPKAIHFDEPWMDYVTLNTKNHSCATQYSMSQFRRYLSGYADGVPESDEDRVHGVPIDVDAIMDRIRSGKIDRNLESKYREFKLRSTLGLFSDLVDHVKQHSATPVLVTANASPADWGKVQLAQYLDYLSPEINHSASQLSVPDAPISAYMMGNAIGLQVFATAYGNDWKVIKSGGHELLACAWIAQAYAVGQYMNLPLKAWVPGSTYTPTADVYKRLSAWIKEMARLLDGYEPVSSQVLLVSIDALRDPTDKRLLQNFIAGLVRKGVLFRIVLDKGKSRIKLPLLCLEDDELLVVILSEYYSKETQERIKGINDKHRLWKLNRDEMGRANIDTPEIQVEVLGEQGIYVLPRKKSGAARNSIVLHLLNRDYVPQKKAMAVKGPFRVRVSREIFGQSRIRGALLHQPNLAEGIGSVDRQKRLAVRESGDDLIVFVPSLDIWGIIEFTYI